MSPIVQYSVDLLPISMTFCPPFGVVPAMPTVADDVGCVWITETDDGKELSRGVPADCAATFTIFSGSELIVKVVLVAGVALGAIGVRALEGGVITIEETKFKI